MPQRYPDPDRGHCWDSILLFLSELVDAGQRALCIAELRNPTVRRHIGHDAPLDNTELITTYVRQIEVRRTVIAISLLREDHAPEDEKDNPLVSTARLGGEDASYLVPMLISRNI